MRTIDSTGFTKYTIQTFVDSVYSLRPGKILFWDTCGLLDIIRFVYRQEPENTMDSILSILEQIENDDVISIASELTVKEWNDNISDVFTRQVEDLQLTTKYHKRAADAINKLKRASLSSSPLSGNGFENLMEDIAFRIINKTFLIKSDEVAQDAIIRLSDHLEPGGKKSKSEVKDCVIWETMLALSSRINAYDSDSGVTPFVKVFYTVNTDDFADKSRTPYQFHRRLLSEAAANSFLCCLSFSHVDAELKR